MASPYSDTPETDDQLRHRGAGGPPSWHVHETFARKLERERNTAWHSLARIHGIMVSKEERGEDVLLGSTAFKSVTKWASYFPPPTTLVEDGPMWELQEQCKSYRDQLANLSTTHAAYRESVDRLLLIAERDRAIIAEIKRIIRSDAPSYEQLHSVAHALGRGTLKSHCVAAETADEKPDGQAENETSPSVDATEKL